jgi:hypothetical protein
VEAGPSQPSAEPAITRSVSTVRRIIDLANAAARARIP